MCLCRVIIIIVIINKILSLSVSLNNHINDGPLRSPATLLCQTNRSLASSKLVPHVYYVNLRVNTDRRLLMQQHLHIHGYNSTRIEAITPAYLISKSTGSNSNTNSYPNPKSKSKSKSLAHNTAEVDRLMLLESVTTSHLQAIYTAVSDYKHKDYKHTVKDKLHYAIIMEDDARFLFDIHDWGALIRLQSLTFTESIIYYDYYNYYHLLPLLKSSTTTQNPYLFDHVYFFLLGYPTISPNPA
jgi:GR25 family glycosyltransferase involved in LPS biosynthesis